MSDQERTAFLGVRLTEAERRAIKAAARRLRCTSSDVVRIATAALVERLGVLPVGEVRRDATR